MKHYAEAQKNYESSLLLRKSFNDQQELIDFSHKDQQIILGVIENFTETEIKYRIAKCLVENQKHKEANTVLLSVAKPRPAKVNMLICRLQSESGTEKNLIALHKEILKKCPLAFESIDSLLSLGVKGNEVNSFIINTTSEGGGQFDWLNLYIKGVSEFHSRKYAESIMTLSSIDSMKNNPKILATIGEAFYFSGEYERGLHYLKRSYDLYPFMKHGIQKYAILCEMYKKTKELQQMVRPSSEFPYEYSSENWFVFATYLYSCLKLEKAQYFIHRVLNQQKNVDALILNAKILHSSKKSNEALICLRSALKHEPYRFEVHRLLVEILIATDKGREAQNQALKTLKLLGDYPRTLTLVGSTYLKNPVSKEKAKLYIYKALELNEYYVKAVFFLAQILIDDKEVKAAIALLEKTAAVVSNIKINLMLADLYAKTKNLTSALDHYTKVLNLDSTNRLAVNGIMSLGVTSSSSLESVEDDADSVENSRNKNDDTNEELIWSDIEMEIH